MNNMVIIKIFELLSKTSAECKKAEFLGLKPWYEYLTFDDDCNVKIEGGLTQNPQTIWLVVASLVENLVRIAALVSFVFVIVSGFKMMLAQGNPEAFASARKSLINALIGLVISLLSATTIGFLTKVVLT